MGPLIPGIWCTIVWMVQWSSLWVCAGQQAEARATRVSWCMSSTVRQLVVVQSDKFNLPPLQALIWAAPTSGPAERSVWWHNVTGMSNSLLCSREQGSVSGTRWSMQPCSSVSSGLGRNAQLYISPRPFVKLSILIVNMLILCLKSITGKSEASLRMDAADYNFTVLPAGLIPDSCGIAKIIWWKGWTLQSSKKRGLQSPWICLFQAHLIIIIAIIMRIEYSLIPGCAGAFNLSKSTTSCPLCT